MLFSSPTLFMRVSWVLFEALALLTHGFHLSEQVG